MPSKKRNKPLNLTNIRYGDITALERIPKITPPKWVCKCDYGHSFPVPTISLTHGRTTTCPICEELKRELYDNTDTVGNKINDLEAKTQITDIAPEALKRNPSLPEGIYIKYNNKLQSVTQWAEETNIPIQTIMSRLYSKWTITETFEDADFNIT